MTVVRARLAPGRSIDADDFTDITAAPVDEVAFNPDGTLAVTFTAELTAAEQQAVEDRIAARNSTEETLRQQARDALSGSRAFINTTAAQLTAGAEAILADGTSSLQEKDLARAVKALTGQAVALSRQNIRLSRVMLGMFEAAD